MSLEDLEDQGVLLPEAEWGTLPRGYAGRRWRLVAIFAAGIGALGVALLGDGGWLTWAGIAAFLAAFFGLVVEATHAVKAQRRRVARAMGGDQRRHQAKVDADGSQ